MPKHGFEFFKLDWREVGHLSCDDLVFQKAHFPDYTSTDEVKFVAEFIVGVSGEVVFFDVGLFALFREVGEGGEVFG